MKRFSGSLFAKIVTIELARIIPIIITAAPGKQKSAIKDLLHPKYRVVTRRRAWGAWFFSP
jgi:hypothetical protein